MATKSYYQRHRAEVIAKNTARAQLVVQCRKEILSQFPCKACGNTDPSVIQWHHVEPELKELELFRTNWSFERFWNEVLKCIPLCANCHVKIHKDELCLLPIQR